MRYVLLTWNPGPRDDEQFTPEQWLEEMVIPLREGRLPDGDRWSVGTNWKTIEVGDLACMFRQGMHGRGIVAVGVITRSPFLEGHWDLDKTGDACLSSAANQLSGAWPGGKVQVSGLVVDDTSRIA